MCRGRAQDCLVEVGWFVVVAVVVVVAGRAGIVAAEFDVASFAVAVGDDGVGFRLLGKRMWWSGSLGMSQCQQYGRQMTVFAVVQQRCRLGKAWSQFEEVEVQEGDSE